MKSQLEVEDITVMFGGQRALSGVSLKAERGHVTGLIGPNGAGKSTLFDVISGLRKPATGKVFLGGRDVTGAGPSRRAKHGLARTFQRLELFGRLSVRDNLLVAAELGSQRRKAGSVADDIIDRLGLGLVATTTADSLSTGMGRLVEVARAMAVNPTTLLLDEPAAGQDREETERFSLILRSLAEEGMAVLLVEHDMELVMNVCDQVYVLDLGKIISVGPPELIRRDDAVLAAYLGGS